MVISQMNLLLSLVNDTLDLKMIEQGRFFSRKELFKPEEVFNFILNVFSIHSQLQNSKLTFEEFDHLQNPNYGGNNGGYNS